MKRCNECTLMMPDAALLEVHPTLGFNLIAPTCATCCEQITQAPQNKKLVPGYGVSLDASPLIPVPWPFPTASKKPAVVFHEEVDRHHGTGLIYGVLEVPWNYASHPQSPAAHGCVCAGKRTAIAVRFKKDMQLGAFSWCADCWGPIPWVEYISNSPDISRVKKGDVVTTPANWPWP